MKEELLAGEDGFAPFASTLDARLLLFNFVVALLISVFFSLAPTLQLRRPDLTAAMRQQSGTGTGAMLNFRRAVVCLQIGLSVILLIGAGLFIRTMQKIRQVDVGFTTVHLVTFGINPKLAGYAPASIPALHQRVLDTLTALPGTQSVGATDDPELAGNGQGGNVVVAGYTAPPEDDVTVEKAFVTPGFFSTLQVPLLAGRFFTEGDTPDHPLVAVVNESFAKHFCGSVRDCVGRQMNSGDKPHVKLDQEIVGVVRDTKHQGVREPTDATLFRPIKQSASPDQLSFYVRTYGDPAQVLPTIRRSMQQLDAALALNSLRTMDMQIDDSLSNERMVTLLAISFGVLATLLAGVGIYGVLAYTTAQRTREIGIRIALGSTRTAVARIVLIDVLRLAGMGLALALPIAVGLSRLLRNQLFGVSPSDPVTISGVIVLIVGVAFIAALVPARRAASINPNEALRTE